MVIFAAGFVFGHHCCWCCLQFSMHVRLSLGSLGLQRNYLAC